MNHGVSGVAQVTESPPPLLAGDEAERRELLLAELWSALDGLGVRAVLARHHRLVLDRNSGYAQSGITEPVLHVLPGCGVRQVTTDGTSFRLDSGDEHAASDVAGAAKRIASTPEVAGSPGLHREIT